MLSFVQCLAGYKHTGKAQTQLCSLGASSFQVMEIVTTLVWWQISKEAQQKNIYYYYTHKIHLAFVAHYDIDITTVHVVG